MLRSAVSVARAPRPRGPDGRWCPLRSRIRWRPAGAGRRVARREAQHPHRPRSRRCPRRDGRATHGRTRCGATSSTAEPIVKTHRGAGLHGTDVRHRRGPGGHRGPSGGPAHQAAVERHLEAPANDRATGQRRHGACWPARRAVARARTARPLDRAANAGRRHLANRASAKATRRRGQSGRDLGAVGGQADQGTPVRRSGAATHGSLSRSRRGHPPGG